MYGFADDSTHTFARPARSHGFRLNWWALGLAGVAALAMAVCLKPAPASAPSSVPAPQAAPAATEPEPAPKEISLLDSVGKACVGLLIAYGAGWGLVRMRRGGLLAGLPLARTGDSSPRLRIVETLPLGRQQGALHLVEVEGVTLLVGVVMDQMQVLWSNASDATPSLPPVNREPQPAPVAVAPPPATVASPPLELALERPVRAEADWAQERGRLISALMKGDPAMGGGERS